MLPILRTIRHAILSRRVLPAAAGILLLVVPCGTARGAAEDDLTNGRLGYKWTPEPPKQPLSPDSQMAWDVAKWGGGGLLVLWFLRKLASSD